MKHSLKIKYSKTQCWWGCQAIGPFIHCWWKCIMVQPLWKRVCQLLIELKTWLTYGFSDPTPKQLPRKIKTYSHLCLFFCLYHCWILMAPSANLTPPPPTDMQWALSLATKFNVIFAIYLTNFGSNPKSLNWWMYKLCGTSVKWKTTQQ